MNQILQLATKCCTDCIGMLFIGLHIGGVGSYRYLSSSLPAEPIQ